MPNFSEGRDQQVIDAIAASIQGVRDVKLLDVDPGRDTNRTVVTFVGPPEAVIEAAFQSIKKASELVDMRNHKGAHARMGTTDVCPFIPVAGLTMEDCVRLAHRLGKRVGEELGIPVYLYEEAATRPERRNLATVRKGEYEGLAEKLMDPQWKPDYGPVAFNERSGATVIGAREFLIAYNVNLNTRDRKLAHDIALNIREAGRAKRDANGKIIRDEQGQSVMVPGKLRACKAVGWYIDQYRLSQISINLTNYRITPPHVAFEVVREEARMRGLRVTGSELVGLIPKEAMLMAGRYYLRKQGRSSGVPEADLIRIAAQSLGLGELAPFDPQEKIIDYQVVSSGRTLVIKTVEEFVDEVSADSPAPGGGSVAALAGALSAALGSMVANLTHGKPGYERVWEEVEGLACQAQQLKGMFLQYIDADTLAFQHVMDAFALPKTCDEDKKRRAEVIEEATRGAACVPLDVMKASLESLAIARRVAEVGNINSVSDAGVAALCARAGLEGAALNVRINLSSLHDAEFVAASLRQVDEMCLAAETLYRETGRIVGERIESLSSPTGSRG